jgi:hypothetical protein
MQGELYMEVEIIDKIKKRIPAHLWYKYFHIIEILPKFNTVQLPKIKREFK